MYVDTKGTALCAINDIPLSVPPILRCRKSRWTINSETVKPSDTNNNVLIVSWQKKSCADNNSTDSITVMEEVARTDFLLW